MINDSIRYEKFISGAFISGQQLCGSKDNRIWIKGLSGETGVMLQRCKSLAATTNKIRGFCQAENLAASFLLSPNLFHMICSNGFSWFPAGRWDRLCATIQSIIIVILTPHWIISVLGVSENYLKVLLSRLSSVWRVDTYFTTKSFEPRISSILLWVSVTTIWKSSRW